MKKSVIILVHISFWVMMTFTLLIIAYYLLYSETHAFFNPLKIEVALLTIIPLVYLLIPFYTFYFYLFDKLANTEKRGSSTLLVLLFVIYFILLVKIPAINRYDILVWPVSIALGIILTFIFGSLGSLFNIVEKWYNNEKVIKDLERKNLRIELDLLKLRLNPHFLFNTINNIDVLIGENSEKASQYLKKLSGILRFMLYRADSSSILLKDELENIAAYLDLQKIRTSNPNYITFEIHGQVKGQTVAPMVFIPFIENAIKYASNKKVKDAIRVQFDITDHQLNFVCINYFEDNQNIEIGGLGNNLIKKRLNLLYKDKHSLTIDKQENQFVVKLNIGLHDH